MKLIHVGGQNGQSRRRTQKLKAAGRHGITSAENVTGKLTKATCFAGIAAAL
jgi:hypothetical protein